MPIPADQIDAEARKVVRRLVRYEHQAYLVGGCVRDLLLERAPKDFDIATSATPTEVKALFRNCRIIGRRFRLAHIFFGPKIIETATFRANPRDSEPLDGDEPGDGDLLIRRDNVFGTAEEDARRRDFTINGLFYDIEADQVIDYVGGLHDLAGRTVRTIGDPEIRFREDPVRILRAIKFAARLDFEIDPSTYHAILSNKDEIPKCAPPRVLEEIYRLLRGGAARRSMELLRDTGVLAILMPELSVLLRERPASPEAGWLARVLDRVDSTKERVPSNAVLLCALAGPLLGPTLLDEGDGRSRERSLQLDEQARLLWDQMRASRRDVERARQILLTLRRLAPSKRRRGKTVALVRRDWFAEALQVYELLAHAMRPDAPPEEDVDHWRRLQSESDAAQAQAQAQGMVAAAAPRAEQPEATDPRRRRRRRRGGRPGRSDDQLPGLAGLDGDVELDDDAALPPVVPERSSQALGAVDELPAAPETRPTDERAAIPTPSAPASAPSAQVSAAAASAQASAAPPSTGNTTPVR